MTSRDATICPTSTPTPSVLLANGTEIVTVAAQLGHASASTTENFYAHIIEENKAKASECIADVLLRKKA